MGPRHTNLMRGQIPLIALNLKGQDHAVALQSMQVLARMIQDSLREVLVIRFRLCAHH